MNKNKGFTLIELLVVIAIIGILSSVVLASLNTARDKGSNAAAKASLNNARAQAELYYDDNDRKYTTVCTAGTNNISSLISGASNAVTATAACFDDDGGWAAEIQLNGTGAGYYCVDSSGYAGDQTNTTISEGETTCG